MLPVCAQTLRGWRYCGMRAMLVEMLVEIVFTYMHLNSRVFYFQIF